MKKNGRPPKNLEDIHFDGWDQLDALIIWSGLEYCAERLGISADTLSRKINEKHGITFAEYKDKKKEAMRLNLRKKQYDVAMAGNVSMLIWLGKNELGQTDKQHLTSAAELTDEQLISEAKEVLSRLKK